MLKRIFNLSEPRRLIVLAITVGLVLTLINIEIVSKERIIKTGTTVLLRLAPRDPRSLLQGDYMALRYSMVNQIAVKAERAGSSDGAVVIELGKHDEAKFFGLYTGQSLEGGQYLLRYRKRGDSIRLASDAFFFEEGSWQTYSRARFGEVRVNAAGEAVLVGLRNVDGERLGEALHQF